MKKVVREKKIEGLFLLLIILVAVSLFVDLASLNALYGLSKAEGLKGELASLTKEYCENLAAEAYDETYQEVLDECLADAYIIVKGYYPGSSSYGYYPSGAEKKCKEKADQAGQNVASNARSACMALVKPEPAPHDY